MSWIRSSRGRPASRWRVGLLLALAACDGATEPKLSAAAFHALLLDHTGERVWRFVGDDGSPISPDSLPGILDFAVARDGRMAYVTYDLKAERLTIAEFGPDGEALRNALTGPVRPTSNTGPRDLAYSPDGSRLAWAWVRGDVDSLFVLDPGSSNPRGVAARPFVGPSGEQGVLVEAARMRWSPRGDIVFGAPGALAGIDPISGSSRTLISGVGYVADFDFTTDGRLAFSTRTSFTDGAHLFAQRVPDGPFLDFLPDGSPFAHRVRWSPDGARLATIAADTTYFDSGTFRLTPVLTIVRLDGTGRVANSAIRVDDLVGWTRDGRVLISGGLTSGTLGDRDVYVVPPRGAPINLTGTPNVDEWIVK